MINVSFMMIVYLRIKRNKKNLLIVDFFYGVGIIGSSVPGFSVGGSVSGSEGNSGIVASMVAVIVNPGLILALKILYADFMTKLYVPLLGALYI